MGIALLLLVMPFVLSTRLGFIAGGGFRYQIQQRVMRFFDTQQQVGLAPHEQSDTFVPVFRAHTEVDVKVWRRTNQSE